MGKRKQYSREYKLEAVRLSETSDKTVAQLERELGLHRNQLVKWRGQYRQQGSGAFVGQGHSISTETRLEHLERAYALKCQEVEVLKKALVYFAKDQP
jgi:transposase-like protein